ncbi:hypothetical protein BTO00_07180 [Vibrio campbellii]|uniref:hypothetical protein n=1 Tax=Vibrio campbellii TaxID=680 RepID=UPI000CF37427|nr:hypothetical protein [Vibrio campbellii]PQJ45914.1 hypothetical protein BTO00_07180 [Vibrio campbellii]
MRSIMSFFVIGVLLWSPVSFGASTSLSGNIKNLTTTTQGLLIKLDTGLPDNCEGSSFCVINQVDPAG